jgi:PhzF family phenazine biosynthesis protein
MTIPLFHVDAFTDRPFAGNPAAVCLLPAWMEDRWLQAVAREMNLPMTAFLVHRPHAFDLRWFTPKLEVPLCGHATLAAAHVLGRHGHLPGREVRFATKSGPLKAVLEEGGIELDFPLIPEQPAEAPPGLVEALGVVPRYVGKNSFDFLVEVASEAVVRGIAPDFQRLAALPGRGIIVTSRSAEARFDFVSRFFAPALGLDEDQVTGSAHCCLADFWQKRLEKTTFVAFQASARGGVVNVRVVKDRVFLSGKATTVAKGELLVEGDGP